MAEFSSILPGDRPKKRMTPFYALGLMLPFQPSMQEVSVIEEMLRQATCHIRTSMQGVFSESSALNVEKRLKKLFTSLNYRSHRKSIAVMLNPAEDRVLYLNFPGHFISLFNDRANLLDLTSGQDTEPGYYLLVLQKNRARIYENHQQLFHTVHELSQATGVQPLIGSVQKTLDLINPNQEKPVFVMGHPDVLELFFQSSDTPEVQFEIKSTGRDFSTRFVQSVSEKIAWHWKHWHARFIAGNIQIASRTHHLIGQVEAVVGSLRKNVNGVLLIHQPFRKQIQRLQQSTNPFKHSSELVNQIELFAGRGNQIHIMDTNILKNFGGMVLLKDRASRDNLSSSGNGIPEKNRPLLF